MLPGFCLIPGPAVEGHVRCGARGCYEPGLVGAQGRIAEAEALDPAHLPSSLVRSQIDLTIVVNEAKANPIQPPRPAQHIPVNHRIGEEVDKRVRRKSESVDLDSVAVRVK